MRVDQFDFELPEANIALRPVDPRDSARMLWVNQTGDLQDSAVLELPDLLTANDALIFNNTKVIPGQLVATRQRGENIAKIGVTLHMREKSDVWRAFLKPAKRVNIGEIIVFSDEPNFSAIVETKFETGDVALRFNRSSAELDEAIKAHGIMPLPPYIAQKRATDEKDARDYQTIYAKDEGAVAAPTAGLHFTDRLLDAIAERGIAQHYVTLHVGAGTFLPVKADDTNDHLMHSEIGILSQETADALNKVRANGGRIVAVGTTSLRLLESAADENGVLHAFSGPTDIFITPGYKFRAVDVLMTNFHLPKSTLFMLVSAFCGLDTMRNAYAHAIKTGYRFYSYGDSSLLFRKSDTQ